MIEIPCLVYQAAFCFCILVFASWCVGEGGEILGEKYDASVVGGLLIAWLNTAPEAIFFITALENNHPQFAVGAVSGSTIVVCTIAVGACIWIGSRARESKHIYLYASVKKQCQLLAVSVLCPLAMMVIGFNWIIFIFGICFYIFFLYNSLTGQKTEEDKHDVELGKEEEEEGHGEPLWKGIAYLVVGGMLIFIFSGPFISSVADIASSLKINPILLAFFLAPIASEAPEILESISLSRKGSLQTINIAFSNLIGGTVTKTTLLTAIFCYYGLNKGLVWEAPNYTVSFGMLGGCAFVAATIGIYFGKMFEKHALILFSLFVFTGIIQYFYNTNPNVSPII